jgi:hypothetical protein
MGYSKHIGRVGALAVALGIGTAVAGPAWADTGPSDSASAGPASSASGDDTPNTGPSVTSGSSDTDDPIKVRSQRSETAAEDNQKDDEDVDESDSASRTLDDTEDKSTSPPRRRVMPLSDPAPVDPVETVTLDESPLAPPPDPTDSLTPLLELVGSAYRREVDGATEPAPSPAAARSQLAPSDTDDITPPGFPGTVLVADATTKFTGITVEELVAHDDVVLFTWELDDLDGWVPVDVEDDYHLLRLHRYDPLFGPNGHPGALETVYDWDEELGVEPYIFYTAPPVDESAESFGDYLITGYSRIEYFEPYGQYDNQYVWYRLPGSGSYGQYLIGGIEVGASPGDILEDPTPEDPEDPEGPGDPEDPEGPGDPEEPEAEEPNSTTEVVFEFVMDVANLIPGLNVAVAIYQLTVDIIELRRATTVEGVDDEWDDIVKDLVGLVPAGKWFMKLPGVKSLVTRAVGPLKDVLIARLRRDLPTPSARAAARTAQVRIATVECDQLPQCVTAAV